MQQVVSLAILQVDKSIGILPFNETQADSSENIQTLIGHLRSKPYFVSIFPQSYLQIWGIEPLIMGPAPDLSPRNKAAGRRSKTNSNKT